MAVNLLHSVAVLMVPLNNLIMIIAMAFQNVVMKITQSLDVVMTILFIKKVQMTPVVVHQIMVVAQMEKVTKNTNLINVDLPDVKYRNMVVVQTKKHQKFLKMMIVEVNHVIIPILDAVLMPKHQEDLTKINVVKSLYLVVVMMEHQKRMIMKDLIVKNHHVDSMDVVQMRKPKK